MHLYILIFIHVAQVANNPAACQATAKSRQLFAVTARLKCRLQLKDCDADLFLSPYLRALPLALIAGQDVYPTTTD